MILWGGFRRDRGPNSDGVLTLSYRERSDLLNDVENGDEVVVNGEMVMGWKALTRSTSAS